MVTFREMPEIPLLEMHDFKTVETILNFSKLLTEVFKNQQRDFFPGTPVVPTQGLAALTGSCPSLDSEKSPERRSSSHPRGPQTDPAEQAGVRPQAAGPAPRMEKALCPSRGDF